MKMDMTKTYFSYTNPNGSRPYNTRPFGHICHNGLNFRHSVSNPNSRLFRMLTYIMGSTERGVKVTRKDILRDVFLKDNRRGWGSYLFSLSNRVGFTTTHREGNNVYYTVTTKGYDVISHTLMTMMKK